GFERGGQPSARVCDDHRADAPGAKGTNGETDLGDVVALVVVHAPAHDCDVLARQPPDDEFAGVTRRGAAAEAGDLRVRDSRRILDVARETAETAAQDHGDLRPPFRLGAD